MSKLILVTGGSRSGKSRYAMDRALQYERRVFIASAVAFDEGMRERIARHQAERADSFTTIEEPIELADALAGVPADTGVVLIDCLTVWLGNLMHGGHLCDGSARQIQALSNQLVQRRCDVIVVTNEVGMGVVPENAMAREFRDAAGFLNQDMAALADEVIFTVSGIPMTLKRGDTA